MTAATINTTAVGLQGRPLANTAPTVNQLVGWNGTTWTPQGPFLPLTGGTLTGNITTTGSGSYVQTTGSGFIMSPGNAGSFLNGNGTNIVSGRAYQRTPALSTRFLTSSQPLVMCGIASQFTPRVSGTVIIACCASIATDGPNAAANVVPCLGTGTPPAQGAAQVGNGFGYGSTLSGNGYSASMWVPWSHSGLWGGLSIGTTYWVDIAICNNTGNGSSAYIQWAMIWVGEY